MTDISLRPTYTVLTNEQRMMVYDYWAMQPRTFEEVKQHFPELHLHNNMISDAIDYGNSQINIFTNYREREIRIVADKNESE